MANPILPLWEYIPDGEPRQFGDRVYIYGSHDRVGGCDFCDYKLKVWSAPVDDLGHWVCHGHCFHTRPDSDHASSVPHTENELYAPDVIEKDGKYYLYTYIVGAKGCVSVSDRPEGPFEFLSTYEYAPEDGGDDGVFNDVGVLVDDDGRVYCYYGYENSYMNEIDGETMYRIVPGSLRRHVIADGDDVPWEERFFEASSPRKIGDTYYLIYSPRAASRLAYATSSSSAGPFTYRGYLIDNGVDYPEGNDHGSLCKINGQWYIFYHRMTNNTITSRRACVEKVTILPDGTIPPVEMTSLGFSESLSPYEITKAEIACVLKGGCFVTEKDVFTRIVTNVGDGNTVGYKYFDFGDDYSTKTMLLVVKIVGAGCRGKLHIMIDAATEDEGGTEIGTVDVDPGDAVIKTRVQAVTGRRALYFRAELARSHFEWMNRFFDSRSLCGIEEFVFMK